jgi:hypothetical protein
LQLKEDLTPQRSTQSNDAERIGSAAAAGIAASAALPATPARPKLSVNTSLASLHKEGKKIDLPSILLDAREHAVRVFFFLFEELAMWILCRLWIEPRKMKLERPP